MGLSTLFIQRNSVLRDLLQVLLINKTEPLVQFQYKEAKYGRVRTRQPLLIYHWSESGITKLVI